MAGVVCSTALVDPLLDTPVVFEDPWPTTIPVPPPRMERARVTRPRESFDCGRIVSNVLTGPKPEFRPYLIPEEPHYHLSEDFGSVVVLPTPSDDDPIGSERVTHGRKAPAVALHRENVGCAGTRSR